MCCLDLFCQGKGKIFISVISLAVSVIEITKSTIMAGHGVWHALGHSALPVVNHEKVQGVIEQCWRVSQWMLDMRWYLSVISSSYSARLGVLTSNLLISPLRESVMVRGELQPLESCTRSMWSYSVDICERNLVHLMAVVMYVQNYISAEIIFVITLHPLDNLW